MEPAAGFAASFDTAPYNGEPEDNDSGKWQKNGASSRICRIIRYGAVNGEPEDNDSEKGQKNGASSRIFRICDTEPCRMTW